MVTCIRWGNKTCPYGANTIYQGVALGGRYGNKGSASNMMCSPHVAIFYSKCQGGSVRAYDIEYRVGGFHNSVLKVGIPSDAKAFNKTVG